MDCENVRTELKEVCASLQNLVARFDHGELGPADDAKVAAEVEHALEHLNAACPHAESAPATPRELPLKPYVRRPRSAPAFIEQRFLVIK